jgi:Tol biopolymer transport system component
MADVRPRRHPNLVTIIVVTLILLVLAAAGYAAVKFLLEGKLRFSDVSPVPSPDQSEVLLGHTVARDLQWESADKPTIWQRGHTDLSPDGKKRAFQRGNIGLGPGMRQCDVYLADADGSHERNVTQAARLGGINCRPYWSPDGTMIYFAHADPIEGKTPCLAHFEMWLMRSDGTDPHPLTPKGSPTIWPGQVRWSANSTRLMSSWYTDVHDYDSRLVTSFVVDVRTNEIQVLPNVGMCPKYSPDGSLIASMRRVPGTAKCEKGDWSQLLLTNADGSNPRVLVQQFITEVNARANPLVRDHVLQRHEGYDWVNEFWSHAGPWPVAWSPKGNQIAFLAALPYNPGGPHVKQQVEVWVYDLRTKQAIRITHDDVEQRGVRWK